MKNFKNRIPCLDGLRGISILLVIIGHGVYTSPLNNGDMSSLHIFNCYAQLGVRVFFVLSGFLITSILLKELEETKTISLKRFYIRRAFRIFPVYYAYLLIIALLCFSAKIELQAKELLIASTYMWNYKDFFLSEWHPHYWYIGHTWTLAVEEQFYIFWPIFLVLLGRKTTTRVVSVLIILVPFVRVLTYYYHPEARGQIYMMFHTTMDTLLIGCLLALGFQSKVIERFLERFSHWGFPLIATIILLCVSPILEWKYRGAYGLPFGIVLDSILVAFIMLWLINNSENIFARALKIPALVHIGVLSYSLYIWQQLFTYYKSDMFKNIFPFIILLIYIVAFLVHRYVEKPFLTWRDKLSI